MQTKIPCADILQARRYEIETMCVWVVSSHDIAGIRSRTQQAAGA